VKTAKNRNFQGCGQIHYPSSPPTEHQMNHDRNRQSGQGTEESELNKTYRHESLLTALGEFLRVVKEHLIRWSVR